MAADVESEKPTTVPQVAVDSPPSPTTPSPPPQTGRGAAPTQTQTGRPEPPPGLRRASTVSSLSSNDAQDVSPPPTTFRQRLKAADRGWAPKVGLRAAIIVLGLLGIACAIWLKVAAINLTAATTGRYTLADQTSSIMGICLLGVSLAWCIAELACRFATRPPRPAHPGVVVALDLIIWLAMMPLVLFALAGVLNITSAPYSGSNWVLRGNPTDPNPVYGVNGYSGEYYLDMSTGVWVYNVTWAPQLTRVWNATSRSYYYPPANLSAVVRDCTPMFANCAEQDAFINKMFAQVQLRSAMNQVLLSAAVLVLVGHFILFVWACVDVHRQRTLQRKTALESQIQTMVQTGQIVLVPGPMGPAPMTVQPGAGYPWPVPPPVPMQMHMPMRMRQQPTPVMWQPPPPVAQAEGVRYA